MPPQKLTPEQKLEARQRKNLLTLHNSIRSAWSFGELKIWADVYRKLGYLEKDFPPNSQSLIEFPALKSYLQSQTDELESKLAGGRAATQAVSTPVTTEPKPPEVRVKIEPYIGEVVETPATVTQVDESGISNDSDYGLVPSPLEKAFHYWFQKKAIVQLTDKIIHKRMTGVLLLAGTGTGKTYMTAGTIRRLFDVHYEEGKTYSHIPYLYITRTTVVEQTKRVFRSLYSIDPDADMEIINIEQLRAKAGQLWVKEDVKVVNGEEEPFWIWKKNINPCVVFFDESQAAKNSGSTQHKIMVAYNDLPSNACLVSISATPFTRVSEAKCFAVSTHRPLEHLGFPAGTVLNNDNWPAYAAIIAAPSPPDEYNQAAIERLMKDLDPWVVRVRGVKPQFEADNGVELVPFETKEKAIFYNTAWERFLQEKAKAEQEIEAGLPSGNMILVALLKQAMAAEICHAEGFADSMYQDVMNGKAACSAVKFKGTIIEIVKILNSKYGIPRDSISLIWGGGQTQLTKKQKAKKKIRELDEKLQKIGLTVDEMLEDCDLDEVEDRELQDLPEHLRLGPQDKEERQKEIDKFQSGKSLYCMYTFRAGGVGLSLHHTDEFTEDWDRTVEGFDEWFNKLSAKDKLNKGKCRRKPSGYAVEEDIKFIPVRPRKNRIALTYNAIELVQGVGRLPRLTSLSVTKQRVIGYKGTVEEDIGNIVAPKMRCLSSVVKMHEGWQDVILHGNKSSERARAVKQAIETTENIKSDESSMVDEADGEDE